MLYTVIAYIDKLQDPQQQAAARQQLAPLIRCPHLSTYWLSAAVLSDEAPAHLLSMYCSPLKQLLQRRLAVAPDDDDTAIRFESDAVPENAPASWRLGERNMKEVQSVQLKWDVDVSTVREAAMRSRNEGRPVKLVSHQVSPPMGGFCFQLIITCISMSGTSVGVFVRPSNAVKNTLCRFGLEVSVAGTRLSKSTCSPLQPNDSDWGWTQFFGPGPDGWQEERWQQQGLPTSGPLRLVLTVSDVGHRP